MILLSLLALYCLWYEYVLESGRRLLLFGSNCCCCVLPFALPFAASTVLYVLDEVSKRPKPHRFRRFEKYILLRGVTLSRKANPGEDVHSKIY